jgi:3-oxoacyl-[acyl-carrier protein] reductase
MGNRLKDKVVLITGASGGIGKAFAIRFGEEGAKLLLTTTNPSRAEGALAEIKSTGAEAVYVKADISREEDCANLAVEAEKAYGRVDVLVNNAAIWAGLNITPWDQWTMADWDRIFRVNVFGTWSVCKAIVPMMARQGGGKIINIASNIAKQPASQVFFPYACSKGAMYTFTHSLAHALGPQNINVNAVAPGYTATEASLNQRDSDGTFQLATSSQSFQRRETTEDLTGPALFLASDESSFMTGQVLFVDGGTVML